VVPIIGDFEKVTLQEPDPSDPTKTMERVIRHPIFADPGEGKLIFPVGAGGLVEVPGFGDTAGLEEAPPVGGTSLDKNLEEGISIGRIFRHPSVELQASVVDVVGEQNIFTLPESRSGIQGFWMEWVPRAGDLILLNVRPGTEPLWVPQRLGVVIPVINGPTIAGMDLQELAELAQMALNQGGLLRVGEAVQSGLEGFPVLDSST
jgi:hypothetical protein